MVATITTVNLLTLATSIPYADKLYTLENTSAIHFLAYDPSFASILGPNVSASLVSQQNYNAFHEAGVYNKPTDSIYIASNFNTDDGLSNPVNISIYHLANKSVTSTRYNGIYEPNGGCTYIPPSAINTTTAPQTPSQILWCDEGDFTHASALTLLDPVTGKTTPLLTSYFGHNFSSLNDAKQHPVTGDVWFTDAQYGFFQDFRPPVAIPQPGLPLLSRHGPSLGCRGRIHSGQWLGVLS